MKVARTLDSLIMEFSLLFLTVLFSNCFKFVVYSLEVLNRHRGQKVCRCVVYCQAILHITNSISSWSRYHQTWS